MTIYFCSPDKQLADRISSCGEAVRLAAVSLEKAAAGVLVIDLKYHGLPEAGTVNQAIVALAELPEYGEALALLQCGVRGYGNRHMRAENLAQAIDAVSTGQVWLPPDILARMITSIGTTTAPESRSSLLDALSVREQEVARYVARGMSNQQIADQMFVSLRTVKAHLSSIYEKTGMRNRLELGLRVKETGGLSVG